MAFTKLTKDMNIIQKLDDEPNDVGGLTAEQLKAKFDEGNNAMKEWINNTFIPEAEETLRLAQMESVPAHAARHAAGGDDPVTPAAIGAVKGAWTIYYNISEIGLTAEEATMANIYSAMGVHCMLICSAVSAWTNADTPSKYGALHVVKVDNSRGYAEFTDVNGTKKHFGSYSNSGDGTFLGWQRVATADEVEMKTGTYTGNGSDVKRTVETGGRGYCVLITSLNGMAILTNGSGIGSGSSGTLDGIIYDEAHFINGTITLTTKETKLNASGVTYQYQVL